MVSRAGLVAKVCIVSLVARGDRVCILVVRAAVVAMVCIVSMVIVIVPVPRQHIHFTDHVVPYCLLL